MNLTELKRMPVPELQALAESMGIEDMGRSRKQDLIFAILKSHAKKGEDIGGMAFSRFCRMVLASCVQVSSLI